MRIVLTGGSGDLGRILCPLLVNRGDVPVVLDVRPPSGGVEFVNASITDRDAHESSRRRGGSRLCSPAWDEHFDFASGQKTEEPLFLPVDGAYEYSDEDLKNWDSQGSGTTFQKYYSNYLKLVREHGLDPARKPKRLDISETRRILKYEPRYSLKNLLEELAKFGAEGPPAPM